MKIQKNKFKSSNFRFLTENLAMRGKAKKLNKTRESCAALAVREYQSHLLYLQDADNFIIIFLVIQQFQ